METSAKGLRVLVTAGGAGIGRAIAQTFKNHGARVHTCDIDAKTRPDTVTDVSDVRQVDDLFRAVEKNLGGLDVLINNAGIAGPTARVEDIKPDEWDRCIAVDLNAMFYCTRKGMPMIKAAGGGSIINMSSTAGRLGFPMRSPYAAAKWAVVGFTKSLAAEAGRDNVRVNCIQPGMVEGDRIERVIAEKAKATGVSGEEVRATMLERISLHTTVTAQDVANTALFLATAAGKHISGQAISVCGDLRYYPD